MVSITLAANCAANFLLYPVVRASTQRIYFVFTSCLFSSIIHAARPKNPSLMVRECVENVPLFLVAASLYCFGLGLISSSLSALALDAMHKRVIPDLLEGGGKISYLPRYIATRLVESISTIQNLFHFAIYCSMQGFGYFQKRGLQHLLAAIDSKEGIQERLESLPHAIQCQIYHRIYLNSDRSGKGPNWGKEHALDDLNRLQKAVKQTQAMPYTLYWESNLEQKSYRYTLFGSKPDHGGSGFVNGMGLDPNHAQNFDALSICNAYNPGQEMQGVYLATSGKNLWGAINDYLEAILGLSYQPTGVILEIHAMWDDFFDRNSEGEFRHFCASKGAIMTRVALETYPHKDRLKKIRVIAVTPAALIGITEARVMHFVSPFDIFPYLVAGLRESLLGGNPNVTIVNAPGQERERSAHDPHSIAYQTAIKTYLEQG